jgi:predicted CoA-binding protein
MQELIKEFMGQKKFAVVGAADNPQKYGNLIVSLTTWLL